MLPLGLGLGREAPFLDHPSLFHQRRIDRHRQAGHLCLSLFCDLGKTLGLDRLLLGLLLGRRQGRLAGLGEACREFSQVTSFTEKLAARIDHLDVHLQVVLQPGGGLGPCFIRHSGAGHAGEFTTQRLG